MRWLLLSLALTSSAQAHDHWINKYSNPARVGESCCGTSDCQQVDAAVTAVRGGWRVRKTGVVFGTSGLPQVRVIDEVVPFDEATPSEDGHFWRCQRPDGERRCFFYPRPVVM